MDGKKHKWQWQCWKTSPTWDLVLLPRPFPDSPIQSMKCYQSTYIVILSHDSNIEIWHSKHGQVVYNCAFNTTMNKIDFFDIYDRDCKLIDSIANWTLILANQNGDIISTDCDGTISTKQLSTKVEIKPLKNCFFKLINGTKTIIAVGEEFLILNCNDLSPLNRLQIPDNNSIDCALIIQNEVVISSSEKLYFFVDVLSGYTLWNQNNVKDSHKSPILELIDIDTVYMASISWEKIFIWKRPHFHLTRMFDLNAETVVSGVAEKSLYCLVNSSRYLIIGLNSGLVIFDCTAGSLVTEAPSVSESQIIKIVHLDWLSMLLTISKDGRIRFWAFQILDYSNDSTKVQQSPFSPKSFSSFSLSRQSSTKDPSQLTFLGKSFEKDKEKCQLACFLELEILIKSKDHFTNLEDIGMLTNDGTASLLLWRNRDYALTNLIQLLQN